MTRDAASFDRLYQENSDPWDYETSAYEADKYRRCLELLTRARYGRALELGCSIGVMSESIAARCDILLGLDFAPTAVARARERGIANARFEVGSVPEDWPAGSWDLIVVSEVLYYLEDAALDEAIACIVQSLAWHGDCLFAGYSGETETEITAREAGERLIRALSAARPNGMVHSIAGPSWLASVFSSRP